jgi:hypothetical protein
MALSVYTIYYQSIWQKEICIVSDFRENTAASASQKSPNFVHGVIYVFHIVLSINSDYYPSLMLTVGCWI